jgi:hypothetical protein
MCGVLRHKNFVHKIKKMDFFFPSPIYMQHNIMKQKRNKNCDCSQCSNSHKKYKVVSYSTFVNHKKDDERKQYIANSLEGRRDANYVTKYFDINDLFFSNRSDGGRS